MSEYPIEKNIPLKPRQYGAHKYPFREMEVGDSFYVVAWKEHASAEELRILLRRLAAAYQYIKKTTNKKFAVRTDNNGVRVWRLE